MPAALTAEPLRDTFRIPKRKRHVPTVRARVRETLEKWGLNDLAPDVELAACELVTNAVVHCRVTFAEIEVTVQVDGNHLVLEISDPDRDGHPLLRAGCCLSRRCPMRGGAGSWSTASASGRVSPSPGSRRETRPPSPGPAGARCGRRAAPVGGLTIGMVVYDGAHEMPGRVTGFAGHLVCLARPTGLTWTSRRTSVRPATDWEKRQLKAIAKLHRQRRLPASAQRHGPPRIAVCAICDGNRLLRSLRQGKAMIMPCRSCRATGQVLIP